MSLLNLKKLILLLIVIIACLPFIISGHRHRHRFNRRSPNDSQQILVTVNRTVINITTTTSNATNPKLEPVNKLTDINGGDERNNHYQPVPQSNKISSPDPDAQRKLLDAEVFKSLLRDLLKRLDSYDNRKETFPFSAIETQNPFNSIVDGREGPVHINSLNARHCVLHGLWLSTVAGAAIELVPEQQQGHVEIHTRIFELPDNPYPPLINSQWTGKGIISQESPTTLTIVFQEHLDTEKENHAKERGLQDGYYNDDSSVVIQLPRTAVFVGQCLVCHGGPTLQGAWVVFPATQSCANGPGIPGDNRNPLTEQKHDTLRLATPDSMYLLRHY